MKLVTFEYHLRIQFSEPVHEHRFTVRCFPVSDERQEILSVERNITPNEFLETEEDSFGNQCVFGYAKERHSVFEVTVRGTAKLGMCAYTYAPMDYQVGLYKTPTRYTRMGPNLNQLYQEIVFEQDSTIREKAGKIMEAVGHAMVYSKGKTDIETTAEEALKLGMGVCQDYSHIFLALCREAGIACRYVVGMLMGEGLSHAWVEVYDNEAWYGYDPTNQKLVVDEHVKLSHGRDYEDCKINHGMFCGNANQEQSIQVKVAEFECQADRQEAFGRKEVVTQQE